MKEYLFSNSWLCFFSGVAILCSCKDAEKADVEVVMAKESHKDKSDLRDRTEIQILVRQAKNDSVEAAFKLYNYFSYGEVDYGMAYYWASRVRELDSSRLSEKQLKSAEENIFAELLHVEGEGEYAEPGDPLLPK